MVFIFYDNYLYLRHLIHIQLFVHLCIEKLKTYNKYEF